MVKGKRIGRGPSFTAAEVVDALYRGLLDRPAEDAGLAFQTARLHEGVPLAEIVHGVGHSREYFETWLRGGDLPALMEQLWRGSERRRVERPIYLLHIMKTGGTALVEGLTSVAADRFCVHQTFLDHLVAMPELVRQRASLISGHLGMEAVELLPDDVLTATIIRNPLERVLSHYFHVLRDPALRSQAADLSLEEFVHSPRWSPYVRNFQANNLVQRIGLADFWHRQSPRDQLAELPPIPEDWHPELPLQAVFELTPVGLDEDQLRRQASEQLERIDHVAASEDLDSLFVDLVRTWGIDSPPPLRRANVGVNRTPTEQISHDLIAVINEANPVDLELYERAQATSSSRHGAPARRPQVPAEPVRMSTGEHSPTPNRPHVRARLPGLSRRITARPDLAGAALCLTVAALDWVFVQGISLMALVVLGPCLAVLGGRWRHIALTGLLAVVLTLFLCIPDGVWGTSDQVAVLSLVTVVAILATVAGAGVANIGLPARSAERAH